MNRSPLRPQQFGAQAHGMLSARLLEESEIREERIRASRPRQRSRSEIAARCSTCGQWPIFDRSGYCRGSGSLHQYVASEIVGMPVVR